MKRKPAKRYLVGYSQWSDSTVWGWLHFQNGGCHRLGDYCQQMTRQAAEKAATELSNVGGCIYELVPVEERKTDGRTN